MESEWEDPDMELDEFEAEQERREIEADRRYDEWKDEKCEAEMDKLEELYPREEVLSSLDTICADPLEWTGRSFIHNEVTDVYVCKNCNSSVRHTRIISPENLKEVKNAHRSLW
jgi:hypothetical protein